MIHSETDPTEHLLQRKRELEEKEKEIEKQKKEIEEKIKESNLGSRQKALNDILDLMNTYEIDISDIAIAKKYPEKIKKTSQATKEKKPKFPQPPEGKKYFNLETNKSWSGRGPIDDSIRNHPDPNSLLVDKVVEQPTTAI